MDPSLSKDGSRYTLRLERRLAHSRSKVWRALTQPELLRLWFPCDVQGRWTRGAPLRFTLESGESEPMEGEVLSVERPRLLEFRWGKSVLRFELIEDRQGCMLVFSETFEDGSVAARNAAGWEACMGAWESVLEEEEPEEFDLAVWRVLFRRYVSQFEPLAGTQQGPPEAHPAVVAEKAAAEEGG